MASNEMLCMFLACHMILAVLVQLEIVEIALVKTETPKSVLPFPMQCFIIHIIIYPTIFLPSCAAGVSFTLSSGAFNLKIGLCDAIF